MNFKALILLLFAPTALNVNNIKPVIKTCGKQIKVAIIDTGLDLNDPRFKEHLCVTGHKNFVSGQGMTDIHGHGTHIAGIIEQYAKNANYCLLIYKYWSDYASGDKNLDMEILSIKEAIRNGANMINISAGGSNFSTEEYDIINQNRNTTFVVAAGNDSLDLDVLGNNFYPASYWLPNEKVVENVDQNGKISKSSNYSSRAFQELGENVFSYLPENKTGTLTGTSQSTAIYTGKLVDSMSKMCNNWYSR